jgi:predicted acylesterase/phospholipase RssA
MDLTIAEAMLATCATPPMFTPTSISKDFAIFEYVGGGLGLSNPTREIIAEAHHAFGDEATVAYLLSIGGGHPGVNSVPSDPSVTSWVEFLERLAMDSEKTAHDVAAHLAQLSLYYRLSVRYGLENQRPRVVGDLEVMNTLTTAFLQDTETSEILGRCVDAIKTREGFTTLEKLSKQTVKAYCTVC